MKLSEMNGKELSACLCKIAAPIERIGMDEKTMTAFQNIAGMGDLNRIQQGAALIGEFIPLLLGDHQTDTFAILAAMNGKTVDEISEQKGMQTIRELKSALSDPELMDFFTSSVRTAENP